MKSLPRCCFLLLFLFFNLSSQQNESSAFSGSNNSIRQFGKNPTRFQRFSIGKANQEKMRRRPGFDGIRIAASKSSSISNGDPEDDVQESSTYTNFWRKDPRNRSVFGILICKFEGWLMSHIMFLSRHCHTYLNTRFKQYLFQASFLSLLGFTMVAGPLVS